MVKREIVVLRLEKIDEYITFLDRVKNYSKEDILKIHLHMAQVK